MRMWMVRPEIMCTQHLLGEHAEIHMFISVINHGKQVKGYLEKGLIEVNNLYDRHNELVREMIHRNYRHNSPISEEWKHAQNLGHIDKEKNLKELMSRCSKCRMRALVK